MITKTYKIFSLCDDFNPDESSEMEDMYGTLSQEATCDTYIEYQAMTKESELAGGYSNDPIANRLVELGADDGEIVLIHIDY